MFIGHFGIALAAKRAAPRTSLGMLVAAAQLLDLIWPPLVLAGIEKVRIDPGNTRFTPLDFESYPWSHSLLMAALWSIVAAAAYWAARRYGRGALVVGLAVFSHWALDFITHRPDLPLYPGSRVNAGLGLWNSVPATMIVEGAIFAFGVWLYAASTRSKNKYGSGGFISFVAFLTFIYIVNAVSPPPPNPRAVAWAAMAVFILVFWAWQFDRHRAALSER
jgi:membrane-bound metal-dependent hydrolase YbcI (DUF457 family)